MKMLIERFSKVTDMPGPDENVIEISGELPFEEQFGIFEQAIKRLTASE